MRKGHNMEMRTLNQLCEMCCDEIGEIAEKGNLTSTTLDQAYKLVDIIKDVKKIKMLEQGERYSRAYDGNDYGGYDRGYSYGAYDGTESSREISRRGEPYYSRGGGKEQMMEQIDSMMRGANERQKDVLRRMREELKNT